MKDAYEPIRCSDESDESDESSEKERLVRLDISRMILNGASIEKIKWKYPNYYSKQKTLVGLAHMFYANYAGSDHPFFCGTVHTKAVLVEDYDPLSENDLIGKIVNFVLFSDKSL
jgi:hypothetical protein